MGGNIAERMDMVRTELGDLIADLKDSSSATEFVDPVCWNCGRAHKFYLPGDPKAFYRPCKGWLEFHTCELAPRGR